MQKKFHSSIWPKEEETTTRPRGEKKTFVCEEKMPAELGNEILGKSL
jgi:hypothetical protein